MQIHDIQRIKGGLYARVLCPEARIRQDIFDALAKAAPLISAEPVGRWCDNGRRVIQFYYAVEHLARGAWVARATRDPGTDYLFEFETDPARLDFEIETE